VVVKGTVTELVRVSVEPGIVVVDVIVVETAQVAFDVVRHSVVVSTEVVEGNVVVNVVNEVDVRVLISRIVVVKIGMLVHEAIVGERDFTKPL